ncbi:MAG: hypothetical protein NTZ78_07980 [Candidatus Aureabacteria bacterium]|nr:hypothetical protein [Candidatus Auribacterota bacterium]
MRATLVVVLSVIFAAGLCGMAVAGSIDSPGAPSVGSGMYTLSQIYDYMNSGIDVTPMPSFQEPGAAPGSTMKSTKEIYDDIKAKYIQCNVTAGNVESGKTFFCTQPGSWGVQTGTGLMQPTPTPTSTPTATITPTSTPTSTPPWGESRCIAMGGYWSEGGQTSSGCWFGGAANETCIAVCGNIGGLSCVADNWDDPNCAVCLAEHPGGGCWDSQGGGDSPYYDAREAGYACWYRHSGFVQDCTAHRSYAARYCVCAP